MDNKNIEFRRSVLTTFQVALLGMVTHELRGVTVGWSSDTINAKLYYDGLVGDVEEEIASDIEAEIMASFPDHEISIIAESLEYPKVLNDYNLMAWVYARVE